MKHAVISFMALMCLFFASQVEAAKKPKPKPVAPITSVALPDRFITSPLGNFQLLGFSVSADPVLGSSWGKLAGKIRNDTERVWIGLTLRFEILGQSEEAVATREILIAKISPGETVDAFDKYGGGFLAPPTATGHRFVYVGGSVPTEYRLRLTKPALNSLPKFEDENASFQFEALNTSVGLRIHNKSSAGATIDWNKVSYVGIDGQSETVLHNGVKYADANSAKPPSVIPPGAEFSDEVIPAKNVFFRPGEYGGWRIRDLFPSAPTGSALKGGSFSVFMPIMFGQSTREYMFTFEIADIVF